MPGKVVTVTAKPSMLSTFEGWSGDLSGATNPTTITMNSNKSITATFSRPSIGANKVTLDYIIDGKDIDLDFHSPSFMKSSFTFQSRFSQDGSMGSGVISNTVDDG